MSTASTSPPFSKEPHQSVRSLDAERKRRERDEENDQQRAARLHDDRLRKEGLRRNEGDLKRFTRLVNDRLLKEKIG